MSDYSKILQKYSKKRILVIGDIILDRYIEGNVSRISPEAPVPIVLEERSFYTPGGASNVSNNLSSLGAEVVQVGRIGNDFEGQMLKRQLKKGGIDISGVFLDKDVPTITKTRVIAQHQQVVRIDRERVNSSVSPTITKKIYAFLEKQIENSHAIIISDYGKGLITPELVKYVCELALKNKKIVTVDPKVENFGYYRGVTAITPNKKEAENAIRNIKIREKNAELLAVHDDKLDSSTDIDKAGTQLLQYLDLDSLLITLSEQGMRLFEKGKKPVQIKTLAKEVFDVSGAGDTVISVFTLSLTAGATKKEAANLANAAAGVVVGKMGAVAITKPELTKAIKDG